MLLFLPFLIPFILTTVTVATVAIVNEHDSAKDNYLAAQRQREEENRRLTEQVRKKVVDAENELKRQKHEFQQHKREQIVAVLEKDIIWQKHQISECEKMLSQIESKLQSPVEESSNFTVFKQLKSELQRLIGILKAKLKATQKAIQQL